MNWQLYIDKGQIYSASTDYYLNLHQSFIAWKSTFRLHKHEQGLKEERVNENQVNQNVKLEWLLGYFKHSPQAQNKHKTYKWEQSRPARRNLQG